MENEIRNKILVILGPTACGKTKLAVKLAAEFEGEIISADSRQVYRGMDIGTGKDKADYTLQFTDKSETKNQKIKNIPYHLIDVVDANEDFDLAKFQKLAYKAIDNILKRGKLPIIAGGSGLYLQAIVDGYQLPDSKPDITLRKKQEIKKVSDLFLEINKLSPKLAQKINNSDRQNKRRLIRYLEILNSDKDIKIKSKKNRKYDALLIGLAPNREELKTKIKQRLISRLEKEAMIDEVKTLHQNGLSWKRLEEFGLEYKFISLFLQEKLKYEEMVEKLNIAIRQFAKRQMTWFRRWEKQGTKIIWLDKQDDLIKIIMQFKKG